MKQQFGIYYGHQPYKKHLVTVKNRDYAHTYARNYIKRMKLDTYVLLVEKERNVE